MRTYFGKNIMPFTAICGCNFGRQIIHTNKKVISDENILEELQKAISIHFQNAIEIDYLDKYYRGDQPILYREKQNRPEVNNKVAINFAKMIVDIKTSELVGEPIQYVLRQTDDAKAEEVIELLSIFDTEDKQECDIEICAWKSICGTAYRFIDDGDDLSAFTISSQDPRYTFVVYYNNEKPAFSCQIRKDEAGVEQYFVYTRSKFYLIKENKIIDSGINGNGFIPVVEYPNNSRRLSDIEITIPITDELNKMASDRSNGIEQFVSSWVKFVNCEIDVDLYKKMRQEGVLTVKSNNGSENKADVDVMALELNQSQAQVAVEDLYENLLLVQGLANRQGNTGGDTQGAVNLRNGFYTQEKRSEILEPIFKNSEKMALRIILNRMRIAKQFSLLPSDVEIKISRTKSDNMLTKAEVLQILLGCGITPPRAIKASNLFSDPEQVAVDSKARMDVLYPTEIDNNEQATTEEPS